MSLEIQILDYLNTRPPSLGIGVWRGPDGKVDLNDLSLSAPRDIQLQALWQLCRQGFLTRQRSSRVPKGWPYRSFTRYQITDRGRKLLKEMQAYED